MELWEKEVIFSMSFPRESVDQLDVTDEKMQKFLENNPDIKRSASLTFQEFLEDCARKYVYIPRPEADQRSKAFISFAVEICKQYKIDTTISKGRYSVDISMNIGYGCFEGYIKEALGKLIGFSDDISFFSNKNDADALILDMSYRTHDRCRRTKEQG